MPTPSSPAASAPPAAATAAAASDRAARLAPAGGIVLLEVLLLSAATLLLYREVLVGFVREAAYVPMRSTLVILPVLAAAWIWRRRRDLAADVRPARIAGAILWALGLLAYAAATWPFPIFQFRAWAVVPMLAGIVLWAAGWRVLRECVPLLGVVGLAVPIGALVFSRLTGPVESAVLSAAAAILDRLPGHAARLESIDLVVETGTAAVVVGLGAPHRALGGLLPFMALGLVVVFARRRSLAAWILGLASVPVLAIGACLLRLLVWAVLAVRGAGDPTADGPRLAGTAVALGFTWLAAAATGWILGLLAPAREPGEPPASPPRGAGTSASAAPPSPPASSPEPSA